MLLGPVIFVEQPQQQQQSGPVETTGESSTTGQQVAQEGGEEDFSGELGPANCPICYREMAVPKLLQCGHSFCESCAARVVQGQSLVSCPTCRETTRMPVGGSLPTNYALKGRGVAWVFKIFSEKFRIHREGSSAGTPSARAALRDWREDRT